MSANEQIIELLTDMSKEMAGTREALTGVQKGQEKLFAIVANGNGQPSLMSQVAQLKLQMDILVANANRMDKRIDKMELRETSCSVEVHQAIRAIRQQTNGLAVQDVTKKKHRWGLIIALITTIGGIISAAIGYFAMSGGAM